MTSYFLEIPNSVICHDAPDGKSASTLTPGSHPTHIALRGAKVTVCEDESMAACGAARDFVKSRYKRAFGARIDVTYPAMAWITNDQDEIRGAVGFRFASHEALFLEQYLSRPIQAVLNTPRNTIVEIGNLAAGGPATTSTLFLALALHLTNTPCTYAVATANVLLERRLRRAGCDLQRFGTADQDVLSATNQEWGTYYQRSPHLLVGDLTQCANNMREEMGVSLTSLQRTKSTTKVHGICSQ